jgi:hypothetical protein
MGITALREGALVSVMPTMTLICISARQLPLPRRPFGTLFKQAFSLDVPKPNAPRLRLMRDDGSKNYEHRHGAPVRSPTGSTRRRQSGDAHATARRRRR